MTSPLLLTLTLTVAAPPTIATVVPSPLAQGAPAQVTGTGLSGATVTLGGEPQTVQFTLDNQLVFTVDAELGEHALAVETGDGSASVSVTVVEAPPRIDVVTPDPVEMGKALIVHGSALADVNTVLIGIEPCIITEKTESLVACEAPVAPQLIGDWPLTVSSPHGLDSVEITVVAPPPSVDSVVPNPARIGDIVTLHGAFVGALQSVRFGPAEATIVSASATWATVQVPESASVGPVDVQVTVDFVLSDPVGPFFVQAADDERPVIDGVFPQVAAPGARVWLVGRYFEGLTVTGATLEGCDPRGCSVRLDSQASGEQVLTVATALGSDVATVVVTGESATDPTLASATPEPVFHGDLLVLEGTNLLDVSAVVIGGVVQAIEHKAPDELRARIAPETPLGAEPLFVAGHSASEARSVTVLAPFAMPEPPADEPMVVEADGDVTQAAEGSAEAEPIEAAEGAAEAVDGAELDPVEADAGGMTADAPAADGGGCLQAGAQPGALLPVLLLLLVLWSARSRSVRRAAGRVMRR